MGSETTLFIGSHYEIKNPSSGQTITKYYFAGASRIAMRKYTIPQPMTVEYLLGDHLGSTSITTDNTGAKVSEMRYKPWGEVRYSWTDAGLLESIQNGCLRKTAGADSAAGKWNTFFRAFADKKDDATLKQLWGKAEMAGTTSGSKLAQSLGYSAPEWLSDFRGKAFLTIGNLYRGVAGIPYGGEILGAGAGGLGGGYTGSGACGVLCAVGGALIGGVEGEHLGGSATNPGSDLFGHHAVYYIADIVLRSQ